MGKEKSNSETENNSAEDKNTTEERNDKATKTQNSSSTKELPSELLKDDSSNSSISSSSSSSHTKASSTSSSTSSATSSSSSSSSNSSNSSSSSSISKATSSINTNNNNNNKSDGKVLEEERNEIRTCSEKQELCTAVHSDASNNSNQFKLRVVPLEKLLEKPPVPSSEALNEERVPRTRTKQKKEYRLPERLTKSRKVKRFIESSDSEEDSPVEGRSEKDEEPIAKETERNLNKEQKRVSYAVRRCVVRIKRTSGPLNNIPTPTNSERTMNSDEKTLEKPSTSTGKRRIISDEDSDTDVQLSDEEECLALPGNDEDCDGSDNKADDNKDDDDWNNEGTKSSDSEIIPPRKKRVFQKSSQQTDSASSDSDFEQKAKPSKKKRRRVQRASSDDSDRKSGGEDDEKKGNKRKHIRKIIKTKDLDISTKTATKEEEERRKRIEERQKIYNQIYEQPDNVEVTELVLDFDPETKEALLEVDKGLLKKLKPHQVAGVKFMWDACFETLKDCTEQPGSGCILAHCMGLGKTIQIVALAHTLLINSRKTNVERVLIISPLSTLNNWAREFKHWMGFARKRNIEIYDMSKYKDKQTRVFKLNEWTEEGGICILGYDMYRILANEKAKGLRKKQREQLQQALVDPGPDLVICDEGHLLKNEKTSISKAVTRMRTKRRIVLTGTPLQNNLKEYYCMIQFVKPNLLGTYKEYLNRFVNPITNGQYTDSTERDIRLMKHRSHILHKMLEGCIQRRDYSVLAPYLPPKYEYVVYTTLSQLQELLYDHYMTYQRDVSSSDINGKGARLFQDFQELRRIWTHPMNMRINSDTVIRKRVQANDTDSLDDFICDNDEEEEASSTSDSSVDSSKSFASGGGSGTLSKTVKTRNYQKNAASSDAGDSEEAEEAPQQDDPSEWWKRFVADKELNNINHSPKLVILMRLLQRCETIGDKLLVFSQSLQSLDVIEHFLSIIDSKTKGYEYEGDVGDFSGCWKPGVDYFRLDGSCSVEQREVMCKKFNDVTNLRARLFLISTRAGGLGINLVAANRVVIFDVSWNPSHDTQSIFRVYRFGQEKPCYIYRLIAMGTMEQKLYERQVAKQATAKRVIDEQQISRHYNQSDLLELYTYELKPSTPREIPILPKDRLFAELLSEHEKILFKYHEHDSLLENEESENLSEAERKAAWTEYEAEKTRTVQTAQYMSYDRSAYGGQYGNASGSVTSNKIFGFRSDVLLQLLNMKIAKDHPELTQNQVIQLVPSYLQRLYAEMNNGDPTMYKDLLALHATLAHPSGMYMNPLLYANQNPSAAGYFQGAPPPQENGSVAPLNSGEARPAPGFDPNKVYEID